MFQINWKLKESLSNLDKIYSIKIEYEEFSKWVQEKQKTVTIEKFRPGHAPDSVFKNDFLQAISYQAIKEIVAQEKFEKLLNSSYIIENFKKNEPIELLLNIEIFPTLPEYEFEKINLIKYFAKPTEEDFTLSLDHFKKNNYSTQDLLEDRECALGDVLNVESTTFFKETPDETQFFEIKLGGNIAKELEELLLGKKINDSIEYQMNPDVLMKIKINNIKTSQPLSDDEIKSRFNLNSDEELKDFFIKKIEEESNEVSEQLLIESLRNALGKKDYELPLSVLKDEFEKIQNQMLNQIGFHEGANLEEELKKHYNMTKEEFAQKISETSKKNAQINFLLEYHAFLNKITISDEEFQNLILDQAKYFEKGEKEANAFFKDNENARKALINFSLHKKTLTFLLTKVTIRNQETSVKELFALNISDCIESN